MLHGDACVLALGGIAFNVIYSPNFLAVGQSGVFLLRSYPVAFFAPQKGVGGIEAIERQVNRDFLQFKLNFMRSPIANHRVKSLLVVWKQSAEIIELLFIQFFFESKCNQ